MDKVGWEEMAGWDEHCVYEDGLYGDPRRCPHHPHVETSSPDGMHDAPCGACEAEMEADEDFDDNVERGMVELPLGLRLPLYPDDADDIPF